MILIPKHKDLDLELKVPTRYVGHFKLEAVGLDGRVRPLAEFDNLITTLGADMLGGVNSGSIFQTVAVGSGNTAPALTDTALQTLVASTSTGGPASPVLSNSGSSPYYGITTVQLQFAIGAAAGNLSEVGIGFSATQLFSRALILDGLGSPTTITVLSTEALYVTYTLRQYVPLTDVTGNVTLNAIVYAYTLRAMNAAATCAWAIFNGGDNPTLNSATAYSGAIGAITGSPAGTASNASSTSTSAYTTGSFVRAATATWGLTSGNVGGIGAVSTIWGSSQSRGDYQIGFSPVIPKDSSHILTLNFQMSWAINTP